MRAFIIRRLLQAVLTLFVVSILVFSLLKLIPGDVTVFILGIDAEPEQYAKLREELGLDLPLFTQYTRWASGFLQGNWGSSAFHQMSVIDLVAQRLPVTIHLSILAIIIGNVLGILLGMISAARRNSFLDSFITVFTVSGISAPAFWTGIIAIYLFGLTLGWFAFGGYTSPFDNFALSTSRLIMPVAVMSIMPMARATRQTRSAMLEVIQQDYIRTAWAKGLKERVILLRHGLKMAMIPVITMMFLGIRVLVAGSMLIESVFNIPGMGRLIAQAALNRDIIVVQSCTMIVALFIILANLAADISYGWLDPRIRYD
ncbi:ABC transporter permease [Chloroflexota bacterium]